MEIFGALMIIMNVVFILLTAGLISYGAYRIFSCIWKKISGKMNFRDCFTCGCN